MPRTTVLVVVLAFLLLLLLFVYSEWVVVEKEEASPIEKAKFKMHKDFSLSPLTVAPLSTRTFTRSISRYRRTPFTVEEGGGGGGWSCNVGGFSCSSKSLL